jgi:hypothetical protein
MRCRGEAGFPRAGGRGGAARDPAFVAKRRDLGYRVSKTKVKIKNPRAPAGHARIMEGGFEYARGRRPR